MEFDHFDQAMDLTRTPMGITVGSRQAILNLAADREIAPQIKPEEET